MTTKKCLPPDQDWDEDEYSEELISDSEENKHYDYSRFTFHGGVSPWKPTIKNV